MATIESIKRTKTIQTVENFSSTLVNQAKEYFDKVYDESEYLAIEKYAKRHRWNGYNILHFIGSLEGNRMLNFINTFKDNLTAMALVTYFNVKTMNDISSVVSKNGAWMEMVF